jgi:hypothetical protein
MASIDPIYISTVFIQRFFDELQKGSATGFFFTKDDKIYLVTNKHVVYGETYSQTGAKPEVNKFKVLVHSDRNNLTKNVTLELPLYIDGKPIWFEHSNPTIDVLLIPWEFDRNQYVIATTDENMLDSKNIVINFEKIFVLGYPYGWFDRKNNLPITRIGHLSSPFGVPFNGEPVLLGDVETHQGMSGGPVFMELHDFVVEEEGKKTKRLGSSKRLLVGIHSGQPLWRLIDNATKEVKEDVKHSLINIWFASLIPEIIAQG